jgi:hypothetical protein
LYNSKSKIERKLINTMMIEINFSADEAEKTAVLNFACSNNSYSLSAK